MFAATGAQAQQHEGDLEARVIEVADARGGPVGRVLASGSKFAALIRGLLAVEEQHRLSAAQVCTQRALYCHMKCFFSEPYWSWEVGMKLCCS